MKQFFCLFFLVLTDQFSKYLVIKNFYIGESLNLLPVLDIYLILNTGIAFSLFDDGGAFGRWLLVILVSLFQVYDCEGNHRQYSSKFQHNYCFCPSKKKPKNFTTILNQRFFCNFMMN